ncbi:acyltransferase family protein [Pelagibacterium sediminicola]|uniref:acyltransferase family protein n=1 Tax=Pelagibacterium sediminicola TaxID=2248761 RepID=UPI00130055A3|nr:acyltransferase [Pelagibacterium sediminicola]
MTHSSRIAPLDGVRAVAALVVLAFHAQLPGFKGAFIGVDVFFVLSGYVITRKLRGELATTSRIDMGRFIWERIARLWPLLLLMLTVFVAVSPWLYPDADVLKEFVLSALYVSDFTRAYWLKPDYTNHSWSLAVEMQFYLLWPLVLILLSRRPRAALTVLLGLFAAAALWRITVFLESGWVRSYYALDTRMSGLILGSALAFVSWRPGEAVATFAASCALVVLALCAMYLNGNFGRASVWGGVVDLATVVLIACLTVERSVVARIFAWQPLLLLGAWSYAIYIWHYPIARLTRVSFDGYTSFALTLVLTLILAGVSHEYFEKPVGRWLRSLRVSRRLKAAYGDRRG